MTNKTQKNDGIMAKKKKQKWVKGRVLIEVLGGVATLNEEKSDPDIKVVIRDYDNENDGPAIAG